MQTFRFQRAKQGDLSIRPARLSLSAGVLNDLRLGKVLGSFSSSYHRARYLEKEGQILALFHLTHHPETLTLSSLYLPRPHLDLTPKALAMLMAHLRFEALEAGRKEIQVDLLIEHPEEPFHLSTPNALLQQLLAGSFFLPHWQKALLQHSDASPSIVASNPEALTVHCRWTP